MRVDAHLSANENLSRVHTKLIIGEYTSIAEQLKTTVANGSPVMMMTPSLGSHPSGRFSTDAMPNQYHMPNQVGFQEIDTFRIILNQIINSNESNELRPRADETFSPNLSVTRTKHPLCSGDSFVCTGVLGTFFAFSVTRTKQV